MASNPPDTDQAVRRAPHRRIQYALPAAPPDADTVGLGLFGLPPCDDDPTAPRLWSPPPTPARASLDRHGAGPPPGGGGSYGGIPGGIHAGSVASHANLARMLPYYAWKIAPRMR